MPRGAVPRLGLAAETVAIRRLQQHASDRAAPVSAAEVGWGPAVPVVVVRLVAAEPAQGGQRRKEQVLQPGRWGGHANVASVVPERDGHAKRVTRRAA